MDRLDLGPIVAWAPPGGHHVQLEARGILAERVGAILGEPRLGALLASSGKGGVCFDGTRLEQFGTDEIDFFASTWPPMIAAIGIRKLSVVVTQRVHDFFSGAFPAATARAARAGVELRWSPAPALASGDAIAWMAPPLETPGREQLFEMPTIIDRNAWTKADCGGVAFLAPDGAPPGLGIIFRDRDAALWIFDTWRRQLGERDELEMLRVAIVEGDVPGKPPGYSLTIGPNVEAIVRRAAASGGLSFDITAAGSWGRRMNTAPGGSPHLATFKRLYQASGEYQLLPVFLDGGAVDAKYDRRILKKTVLLRAVSDITAPDDPDAPVLQ